jgi:3-oxoacyl-[acyl-carrier protein] reductase
VTAVALVTGGAGGIGRAICARLAQSGYAVVAGDVSVAAEPDPARAGPGEILDWPMDVTDDASVAWAVAAAAALGSESCARPAATTCRSRPPTGCGP